MKYTAAFLIAGIILCNASCKKHDCFPKPPTHERPCDLAQSTTSSDAGDNIPQYRKEYGENGKVTKVVAGLYTLVLDDSIALRLQYQGEHVYFFSEKNRADTVLIATFDAKKRLINMHVGNGLDESLTDWFELATDFTYTNEKLSRITRHTISNFDVALFTTYDENGNVVRIYQETDDKNAGTFFTYDRTVKATAQFYSDQFGSDLLNNMVYLAEFLGWLPDLEPVNKRTSFKQVFNDEDTTDTEPGYVFNHTELTDHVYDAAGKLLSYKIANGQILFTNYWNCKDKHGPY